jgi:transposase-like protein
MQRAGRGGYTLNEVARILQFHPDSVRYWVRVGELPSEPVDGRGESLIRPADLAAFIRECDAPDRESRREAISAPLVNPAAPAS